MCDSVGSSDKHTSNRTWLQVHSNYQNNITNKHIYIYVYIYIISNNDNIP